MPEPKTKTTPGTRRIKTEYIEVAKSYSLFALKAFVGGAFGALGSKAMRKVTQVGRLPGKVIELDDHRDVV